MCFRRVLLLLLQQHVSGLLANASQLAGFSSLINWRPAAKLVLTAWCLLLFAVRLKLTLYKASDIIRFTATCVKPPANKHNHTTQAKSKQMAE